MTTYISLLRGINVSGQKMIKMEALKKMCEELNFQKVQTYIQSGNIIFQSQQADQTELEKKIEKEIQIRFGFEVPAMVFTVEELKKIISNNPFINDTKKDKAFLHVTFLSAEPQPEKFQATFSAKSSEEEIVLKEKAIYLYCSNGYGRTKLTNTFLENKLKVKATTRNWKTTNELLSIAEKAEGSN